VPRRLVVIIGAGASFDCASELVNKRPELQPPLVKDLFAPRLAEFLDRYPLAQAAAADIRRAIAPESENAVPLERYLREGLRDSEDMYAQRRYRQVPLYLQDVFLAASVTSGRGFTTEPDNYNALINKALGLDDVLFLTLNYDTLLDDRLFIYGDLLDLNSYVSDPKWALIKLHGSVNWGRRIVIDAASAFDMFDRASSRGEAIDRLEVINKLIDGPGDLTFATDEIELRLQQDLGERRFDGREAVYYPALSVPVGEEDELVCPREHLGAAGQRLQQPDGLNLLVIGYSGLDREVLQLLGESGSPLRTLLVANGDERAGLEAAERIQRAFGGSGVRTDNVFGGGFTDLVRTGALSNFVDSVPA
jgi:hypothetical protein